MHKTSLWQCTALPLNCIVTSEYSGSLYSASVEIDIFVDILQERSLVWREIRVITCIYIQTVGGKGPGMFCQAVL